MPNALPFDAETLVERIEAALPAQQSRTGARPAPPAPSLPRDNPPGDATGRSAVGQALLGRPARAPADGKPEAQPIELPIAALAKAGFATPLAPRGPAADGMRLVKQALYARLEGERRPRMILVTSPDRGEGKSYCALNLALSLAMDERAEIALVDADPWPRRPSPLGVGRVPGATDLVAARAEPAQAWRRARDLPLSILPFGAPLDAPSTFFGSDGFTTLLRDAERRAEWVILDGPTARGPDGAAALAARAGHVVLVTASERTTRRALREALERLGCDDRVSLLLNNAPSGPAADWPPAAE